MCDLFLWYGEAMEHVVAAPILTTEVEPDPMHIPNIRHWFMQLLMVETWHSLKEIALKSKSLYAKVKFGRWNTWLIILTARCAATL